MKRRRAVRLAAALLLLSALLFAAACGDDDGVSPTPTEEPTPSRTPRPTATPSRTPSPTGEPLTEPPARDLLDLARRFRDYPYDGPEVARDTPLDHQVGDTVEFTLLDLDQVEAYTVTASVQMITEHAYFFVDQGSPYFGTPLGSVASDFEENVWPTVTSAFGEPWTPGVDGDPRITILHANLRGAGGYVSGSDEYPEAAAPRSAEREMVYLEDDSLGLGGAYYSALLAHELQHLVHFNGDRNEESWVNEGLSEVAWVMAGGGSDRVWEYLGRPDIPLTFWPYGEDVSVHYSASELFFGYLLDHYGGRENARALVQQDGNGIDGVEAYLSVFGTTFEAVFAEFAAACLLDLPEGPYGFPSFDGTTTAIEEARGATGEGTVSQFGTDYIRLPDSAGAFQFDGSDEVTIGIPALDGAFWWSNRSDGIDSRLTREIDLSDIDEATLRFDAWYDIEPGWDYGYVAASTDDGRTWQALAGTTTTDYNPVFASYGPGYTGESDGWVLEEVDLSAYAGQQILLRFEYVTDDATHLTGMAVDNIEIPEIGFSDDAGSAAGWTVEGFRRIEGPLPQHFIVQAISDNGEVGRIELDGDNVGTLPAAGGLTIAISGATRGTAEEASYRWTISP